MANKFSSENMIEREIKMLNQKVSSLLRLEELELKYYKTNEKYQTYQPKKDENNKKKTINSEDYSKYNKDIKKSGGFVKDFLGWLSKIGVLLVSYKISEWVANPNNSKKIASIIKAFSDIGKFITNIVTGSYNFLESSFKNLEKMGKSFAEFFKDVSANIGKIITTPITEITKTINKIPKTVESGFNQLLDAITKNLSSASDKATTEANVAIEEGVAALKPEESQAEPEKTTNQTQENIPDKSTTNQESTKIEKSKVINPEEIEKKENLPKLAKGGLVPKQTATPNNIKPLSTLLLGNTNNQKFNDDIKTITPKFEELMRLPFSVIGGGIVSILKSAIKNNPESENTITPLLNSIGEMFNVPIGESTTELKTNPIKNEDSLDSDTKKYTPIINKGSDGKFQSSNDTSVRGLLADILNALLSKVSKQKQLPEKSLGGNINDSGSGWIHGSHQGYPVSLDGVSTSFIGHGTEYIAKHKTNNNSFVVPFDTPATKTNKSLTKTRISEAIAGGYHIPPKINMSLQKHIKQNDNKLQKLANGGMVEPNGFNDGISLTEFTTRDKKHYYKVATPLAKRFKGFVDELESTGYKIRDIGGYNPRKGENNGQGKYAHPYGAAIDINYLQNPMQDTLKTDMPPNITQMAKKYGLGWGGNWKSKKDAMHFSAMKRELGDGFNGKEIGKGVLTGGAPDTFKTSSTPETTDAPHTTETTATNSNATTTTEEPKKIDFGIIGDAFSKIAQMLGLGNVKDVIKQNVNPSITPKIKSEKNPTQTPSATPIPSPTKVPHKKDRLTTSPKSKPNTTTIMNSGTTNNVASKNVYSASGFNFTSDAHRFVALSGDGNILEPIFV